MSHVFNIAPVGLDAQDRVAVNTATKLLSYDGIAYQLFDGEPAKAHLLILDEESAEGKQALKHSRPGQVKLVLSNKPASAKNTIGIPRPMDLGVLKSVLKKLYGMLQGQVAAQQAADATKQSKQGAPALTASLFNILLDAKTDKQILHIQSRQFPDIFIDGRNHCLATTASETEINQLVKLAPTDFTITRMNPDSFAVHSNNMSIQSLYNLLWLAGIKCSDGKLLAGHKLDAPFRLRAWPNFTRNTFIAEHLKLAAVLAKQTLNLQQLAEMTQVALGEVINFYNAAYAVDLIEFRQVADVVNAPAQPRNLAKQGLLAKIAQRLNLKSIF
ncbi:MAG: hypothetical protein GC149_10430 [Gammaproteobacteria bacterium]|nr:hypothetical protein [Gammaproteobacteria bacterium]